MHSGDSDTALAQHFRRPMPRVDLLGAAGVGGCADVSDGLIADLAHICRASAVTGMLDLSRVPYADPRADWAAQVTAGMTISWCSHSPPQRPFHAAAQSSVRLALQQPEQAVILDGPAAVIRAAHEKLGYTHF